MNDITLDTDNLEKLGFILFIISLLISIYIIDNKNECEDYSELNLFNRFFLLGITSLFLYLNAKKNGDNNPLNLLASILAVMSAILTLIATLEGDDTYSDSLL